jgi:hypothetical protein
MKKFPLPHPTRDDFWRDRAATIEFILKVAFIFSHDREETAEYTRLCGRVVETSR